MHLATIFSSIITILITLVAFFNALQSMDNGKSYAENAVTILTNARARVETPCRRMITYTIGSFDDRFRITKEESEKAIGDAAGVWNDAINKKLFIRTPSGIVIH